MTVHTITSNSSSGFVTAADADRWIVAAGVTVSVADDNAFFGVKSFSRCSFVIRGTVETTGNYHTFHLKAERTNVTVDSSGTILSAKDAIHMLEDKCKVFNDGTIDAHNFGVRFYGDQDYLLNNGTITSDNTAVTFGGIKGDVENHGTISGRVGVSVNAQSGRFDLLNTGTIEGPKYAYVGNDAAEHIRNSGQFIGDVYLRSGQDVFISDGGTVTGSVFGGNGDDTFRLDTATIGLVELKDGGVDQVYCSVSYTLGDFVENLTLTGNAAIDGTGNRLGNALTGNAAANVLSGMGGRDAILAGAGNDTVRGGSGIDQIDGGKGADLLYGGAGKDVIDGSFGRDRIIGEAGSDQLTGGMSRDTFVFADGHGSDTITDFTAKGSKQHDVIDLTDVTEITGLRDLKLHHMQQVGADVVITDGSSHIVLTDVQLSDLSKADFLF